MSIGQELLNVPMGEMIRDMALAIAEAQIALDASSMRVAEMMSGKMTPLNNDGTPVPNAAQKDTTISFPTLQNGVRTNVQMSMFELGFSPTFYQFVDTIIEVKIAIKITRDTEYKTNWSSRQETRKNVSCGENTVQTSQVDASYSAKYGYSAEGSSLLRTKLVPVPAPAILEERIRGLIEAERTPPANPT
ncbi:hypothetical protein BurJ1DRAFT_0634 [Burkholderiales bacterium JOSHI_001]|nr:hypothetical protein BurJ1DRAFT_0634 [Burkholderiales bacterium JOSHI_001]